MEGLSTFLAREFVDANECYHNLIYKKAVTLSDAVRFTIYNQSVFVVRPEQPFPLGLVLKPYIPLLYRFYWKMYIRSCYRKLKNAESTIILNAPINIFRAKRSMMITKPGAQVTFKKFEAQTIWD